MDLQIITTEQNGRLPIDARKLHDFLELSKANFRRWAKTNIEENDFFFENIDWQKTKIIIINDDVGNKSIIIDDDDTAENDGTIKPSRIKKDYSLSFEMAYHLTLQCETQKGHEIRQALIKNKKLEFENKRKIAELSNINQSELSEIKELKKQRFFINKRLRFLEVKTENQSKELHLLVTGFENKTMPNVAIVQTDLFSIE